MNSKLTKPSVSIILPVWNGEAHLAAALNSILDQTYNDFELIVVDDNSTDKTPEIIHKYSIIDSRIKVYRNKENLKLPKSLNIGFSHASGTFYTWTSDDNLLHPNFLKTLVNFIVETNSDIVYSDFNIIDALGTNTGTRFVGVPEQLLYTNSIGASFLYKSCVHTALAGYSEDMFMYEDYDFWFRAYSCGFIFSKCGATLYDYRQHANSLSSRIAMPQEHIINLYKQRNKDFRGFKEYGYNALLNLINYPKQLGVVRWAIVLFQLFYTRPVRSAEAVLHKLIKKIANR